MAYYLVLLLIPVSAYFLVRKILPQNKSLNAFVVINLSMIVILIYVILLGFYFHHYYMGPELESYPSLTISKYWTIVLIFIVLPLDIIWLCVYFIRKFK